MKLSNAQVKVKPCSGLPDISETTSWLPDRDREEHDQPQESRRQEEPGQQLASPLEGEHQAPVTCAIASCIFRSSPGESAGYGCSFAATSSGGKISSFFASFGSVLARISFTPLTGVM